MSLTSRIKPHVQPMLWRYVLGVLIGLGLMLGGLALAPRPAEQMAIVVLTRAVAPVAVGEAVGEAAGSPAFGRSAALIANNIIAILFMSLGGITLARLTERKPPGAMSRAVYTLASRIDPTIEDVDDENKDTYFLLFLFPAGGMVLNGGIMGAILGLGSLEGIEGLYTLVRYVLPHSIVEVPVLILGASIGSTIAWTVFDAMLDYGDVDEAVRAAPRPFSHPIGALCLVLVAAGVVEASLID